MSTNELRPGRKPIRVVWPDDSTMEPGEYACASLEMVDVPGQCGDVQWVKAVFDDGSTAMINPLVVEMILFED